MHKDLNIIGLPFELFSLLFTTIFIPFLGFLLVNIYARLKEKLELRSKLKNTKDYVLFWTKEIIVSLNKNIAHIQEFNMNHKNVNEYKYVTFKSGNLHIDKIKIITPIEIFSALKKNLNGDHNLISKKYFEFLTSLDYLEVKEIELKQRITSHGEKIQKHFKQMQESITCINEYRIQFTQDNFDSIKQDKFLYSFHLLHENNKKAFLVGIKQINKEYMNPLGKICKQALQETPTDTRITKVQKYVQNFINAYYWFEKDKKHLSEYIESTKKEINITKSKIELFVKFHSESKFKNLFKLN